MKVIYVAGPFRAPSAYAPGQQDDFQIKKNVMRAMELGLEVARLPGVYPIVPHALTIFYQGSASDDVWLEGDLELLRRSDAVLMVPGWENSVGATTEHTLAYRMGMPVFYTLDELRAWLAERQSARCPSAA